jgi:hypothetical protein
MAKKRKVKNKTYIIRLSLCNQLYINPHAYWKATVYEYKRFGPDQFLLDIRGRSNSVDEMKRVRDEAQDWIQELISQGGLTIKIHTHDDLYKRIAKLEKEVLQ